MKILLSILLTIFTLPVSIHAANLQPVNPNATPEAKKVYSYLQSVIGKKTLSGHHGMYGNMEQRDLGYIKEHTEKVPAVLELEGGIFAKRFSEDWAEIQKGLVADAIDHWKNNGLVAVCWHWGNPFDENNTYNGTKTKFDIQAAMKDGTNEHEAMIKDLDAMATILRELQDAGVPVLFRPLHEICGGWFWWSMQGEETAEDLWRYIYAYFTDHHKLNNVLWVYSYSHEMRISWLPGLDTIDIIGVDIYKKNQEDKIKNYELMKSVAGDKPIALSECETIPNPEAMNEQGFLWSWFSTWHSRYLRSNEPDFLKTVYNHELVITRDELPNWRDQ
jgi:mannan endo-1,4-beta-mannosidase